MHRVKPKPVQNISRNQLLYFMKNLSYVINGILAIAVIILFILVFNLKKGVDEAPSLKFNSADSISLPVAYVNSDSIFTKYQFAKEASDVLMKKQESSRATLNNKQKQVANEYQEFQRKLQNNAFLTEERAKQEHDRIQKLAADLDQMASRLDNELTMEQMKVNNQLADSVRTCIKEFNKTANFEIIFNNSGLDNILFAKSKYDITDQIINLLNQRHVSAPKK